MTKQIEMPVSEEKQIDSISNILVIMVSAILPLIAIPKVVNTPVNTWYFLDYIGYYKAIFLLIVSMFMLTIMLFKAIARKQRIKLSLPLMLFTFWVFVSVFFAEDRAVALTGYPMRWQGFISYVCYAIVFTFAVNMVKPKYIGKILFALFISASIISIHSMLNYYGIEPLNWPMGIFFNARIDPSVSRAALGNRNTAGAYFVLFTIIALIMFLKNKGTKKNVGYYIALLFSYAGLLVSLTRVAWLGTICALVFGIWFFRKDFKRYLKKLTLVAVAFIVVLLILDFTGNGQLTGRYQSMQSQISEAKSGNIEQLGSFRFFIYNRALKVTMNNPVVGVGPDCFAFHGIVSREEYKKYPALSSIGYFDKVHSEYLEFAATMGIPALVFYLWFILSIFIPWLRKKEEIKPEMLGIFIAWTGYLIQAVFNFGTISVLPVFFVLTGLLQNGLINGDNEEEAGNMEEEENNTDTDSDELTLDDKISLT